MGRNIKYDDKQQLDMKFNTEKKNVKKTLSGFSIIVIKIS